MMKDLVFETASKSDRLKEMIRESILQGTLKPGDPVAFHIMRPTPAGRGRTPQWTSTFVSGALPKE